MGAGELELYTNLGLREEKIKKVYFNRIINAARAFGALAVAAQPQVMAVLYRPQRDELVRIRLADLWATDFEILGNWVIKRAWITVSPIPVSGGMVFDANFPSRTEVVIAPVLWGTGGSTQSSNTVSVNNQQQWSRELAPKVWGQRHGAGGEDDWLQLVVAADVSSITGAPGVWVWAMVQIEVEVHQKRTGDRKSEFTGVQIFEETHDQYADFCDQY